MYISVLVSKSETVSSSHSDYLVSGPEISTDKVPPVQHSSSTAGEQHAAAMASELQKLSFMDDLRAHSNYLGIDWSLNDNYRTGMAALDYSIAESERMDKKMVTLRLQKLRKQVVTCKEIHDVDGMSDSVLVNPAQHEDEISGLFKQAMGTLVRETLESMDATTLQKMRMTVRRQP
jgi:hypothetical protein